MKIKVSNKLLLFILSLIALAVFASAFYLYPKYSTSSIPRLVVLVVIICFVYTYLKKTFKLKHISLAILNFLWWLPTLMFFLFVFISLVVPIAELRPCISTILIGGYSLFFQVQVVFLFFIFIALLVRFCLFLLKKTGIIEKEATSIFFEKKIIKIGIVVSSLVFSLLIYGITFGVNNFKVRNIEIKDKNIPKEFDNFKIVQISDLHLGSWLRKNSVKEVVSISNKLHPDIVCFTGDLVNFTSNETEGYENILSKLQSKYGVYAVLGNHDYSDYVRWENEKARENNFVRLIEFYKKIHWKLLRNETAIIEIDTSQIVIAGSENWGISKRFQKYGDLNKTFANSETSKFTVLLTHDPSHWSHEVTTTYSDINLTLSGHTHGFQMGINSKFCKWSPAKYLFKNWSGLYNTITNGKIQYLYVNVGVGTVGYPGRIGFYPEITLITLKKY